MTSFKSYLCTGNPEAYRDFIHLLMQTTLRGQNCPDLSSLIRELGSETKGTVLIFIEEQLLISSIPTLQPFLQRENYIWISLLQGENSQLASEPYLYDVLDCTATGKIQRFLTRLEKDILCRARLQSLENAVQEYYNISKNLSAEKNITRLLETIINTCMEQTSADGGTIYLVVNGDDGRWSTYKDGEEQSKYLKFVITRNHSIQINLETEVTPITREGIFGYTVLTGQSLRIDDAYHIDPNLEYKHNAYYDQLTGYKTKSILSVPMKDHHNHVLGVVQLINKKEGSQIVPFNHRDEEIIYTFAGQAAVALENNLLYRDMELLLEQYRAQNSKMNHLSQRILKAHEEERKRIARDIHDGPAQSIANASLHIGIMKKYLQRNMMDALRSEMEELNHNLKATVMDIRNIIYDLKPISLEKGLIHAIENYITLFMEQTGTDVGFSYSGDDSGLEYYLISTIYRIVQEAMTNIRKHAEARHVTVTLRIEPAWIYLQILDDGKGFDPRRVAHERREKLDGGFGLDGIRERVELVQGKLSLQSSPGAGTHLEIIIPQK